ncbi:uncharacterized protein DS421_20g690100 [Arachis hypogaea]|nr:uncharacterized protein DS421_20g690100 [Arachis hypogaea]
MFTVILRNQVAFTPFPQAADYILRVVEMVDAPVIYFYMDDAESEIGLLQSVIVLDRACSTCKI